VSSPPLLPRFTISSFGPALSYPGMATPLHCLSSCIPFFYESPFSRLGRKHSVMALPPSHMSSKTALSVDVSFLHISSLLVSIFRFRTEHARSDSCYLSSYALLLFPPDDCSRYLLMSRARRLCLPYRRGATSDWPSMPAITTLACTPVLWYFPICRTCPVRTFVVLVQIL